MLSVSHPTVGERKGSVSTGTFDFFFLSDGRVGFDLQNKNALLNFHPCPPLLPHRPFPLSHLAPSDSLQPLPSLSPLRRPATPQPASQTLQPNSKTLRAKRNTQAAMLLSLCRRCNRRLLQASSRLRQLCKGKVLFHGASPSRSSHSASPSRRRRLALTLLLLAQTPRTIQSQTPYVYTPRYSAGSTVIGKTLYVVSGTSTGHLPQSYVAITDVISLALDKPFPTDLAPWMSLRPGPAVSDARIVPSADQSHLVLGGMGETGTPLVRVYNIQTDTWSPLPPQPIGGNVASPRTSVGIALDASTGAVIVFGGLVPNTAFSRELDVLDTRPAFNNWTWTLVAPVSNFIQLIPLYQPIVLYLPQLQATLLMGGCNTYSARTIIVSCQTFDSAFQIKTAIVSSSLVTSPPQKLSLTSSAVNNILPVPRSSSCHVVLANGDVFMYGGLSDTATLSDAWVLSAESWKWRSIKINNAPPEGRAGATCQLIAQDQVIVIGGMSLRNGTEQLSEDAWLAWEERARE